MAFTKLQIHLGSVGVLCTFALGLASGCGTNSSSDKLDAGQRRYCNILDGSSQGGKDATIDTGTAGPGGGLDSAGMPDAPAIDLSPGLRPDSPGLEVGDARTVVIVDMGVDSAAMDGSRDATGTAGTGGVGGGGGMGGTGGVDARPDVPSDVNDGPSAELPRDLGPDVSGTALDSNDALPETGDTPPDTGDAPPETPDAPPVDQGLPDGPTDLPPSSDVPAPACKLVGYGPWAPKQWTPPLRGVATGADGTPWAVGNLYAPWDFGTGPVRFSNLLDGGAPPADIFLAKLDPASGLATQAFSFGGPKDKLAVGAAVASNGNVGIIGYFSGEIDFTDNYQDGSGPSGVEGTAGRDFLQSSASINFYAVSDGNSSGIYVTPKKQHMVDLGTGSLLSIGSNPTQDAIAICGKTSKAVPNWNDNGATKGVITGGNAAAGGGMDIVVAKIDGATGSVIWGKQFGGAGDQLCQSVAIDNNGDVIIAGNYTGTLDFGGSTTVFLVPNDPNNEKGLLYVAKLSAATGVAIAAQTWGAVGRTDAYGITADASNNIVITGSLGGDIDFGAGISIADLGLTDAFVVKLTSTLAPAWAKSFGDAAFDQTAKTVGVSSTGDVYFGGSFKGGLGTLGLTSASTTALDAFVAQLAPTDGSMVCAHAYGDAAGAQQLTSLAVARAATGALADSILIGGGFSSQMPLGSTILDTGNASTPASFIGRITP
jgi:hypothetical protein